MFGIEPTERKQVIAVRMVIGRTLSRVSTSLANRLTIRPMGVVSKYDIGHLILRFNIKSCINWEAYSVPSAIVIEPPKMKIATYAPEKKISQVMLNKIRRC